MYIIHDTYMTFMTCMYMCMIVYASYLYRSEK